LQSLKAKLKMLEEARSKELAARIEKMRIRTVLRDMEKDGLRSEAGKKEKEVHTRLNPSPV
jgi:hypothetical protein